MHQNLCLVKLWPLVLCGLPLASESKLDMVVMESSKLRARLGVSISLYYF
jgi:hypothetical protein